MESGKEMIEVPVGCLYEIEWRVRVVKGGSGRGSEK